MRVAFNYAAKDDVKEISVEPFQDRFFWSCNNPDFQIVFSRAEAIATYMELERALLEADPNWDKHLKEVYTKEREVVSEDNKQVQSS